MRWPDCLIFLPIKREAETKNKQKQFQIAVKIKYCNHGYPRTDNCNHISREKFTCTISEQIYRLLLSFGLCNGLK